ncbi:hypothetical protein Tco_1323932 [Tanacetum coccineum]
MAGVDVNTLTIEQYLALSRENQAPGVVKPKIGDNVNFEIKSQFMRELREHNLSGKKNEDAHDHIDRVLSIVGYCPPSKTVKQLEDIHNFKQEGDESLYQAWERYNDLLYKCPTHDINSHQKTMADHSQKWHDGTTSRLDAKFAKDLASTRIVPSTRKLNKLKRSDMENLDEQSLLTGIMEDDKSWLKQLRNTSRKPLLDRVTTLAKEAVTKTDKNEDCKAIFTNYGAPLYTPFYYSPKEIERLEQHAEEALIHKTMESLKKIKSNQPFLKEIGQSNEYPKFIKDLVSNKPLTMENEDVRINRRCSALLLNQLPPKEKDPRSFILPCSIGRLDFNNALADLGVSIGIMPNLCTNF